ncbi:hypothetical protein L9F63_004357, partial [Diploptera punctata]
ITNKYQQMNLHSPEYDDTKGDLEMPNIEIASLSDSTLKNNNKINNDENTKHRDDRKIVLNFPKRIKRQDTFSMMANGNEKNISNVMENMDNLTSTTLLNNSKIRSLAKIFKSLEKFVSDIEKAPEMNEIGTDNLSKEISKSTPIFQLQNVTSEIEKQNKSLEEFISDTKKKENVQTKVTEVNVTTENDFDFYEPAKNQTDLQNNSETDITLEYDIINDYADELQIYSNANFEEKQGTFSQDTTIGHLAYNNEIISTTGDNGNITLSNPSATNKSFEDQNKQNTGNIEYTTPYTDTTLKAVVESLKKISNDVTETSKEEMYSSTIECASQSTSEATDPITISLDLDIANRQELEKADKRTINEHTEEEEEDNARSFTPSNNYSAIEYASQSTSEATDPITISLDLDIANRQDSIEAVNALEIPRELENADKRTINEHTEEEDNARSFTPSNNYLAIEYASQSTSEATDPITISVDLDIANRQGSIEAVNVLEIPRELENADKRTINEHTEEEEDNVRSFTPSDNYSAIEYAPQSTSEATDPTSSLVDINITNSQDSIETLHEVPRELENADKNQLYASNEKMTSTNAPELKYLPDNMFITQFGNILVQNEYPEAVLVPPYWVPYPMCYFKIPPTSIAPSDPEYDNGFSPNDLTQFFNEPKRYYSRANKERYLKVQQQTFNPTGPGGEYVYPGVLTRYAINVGDPKEPKSFIACVPMITPLRIQLSPVNNQRSTPHSAHISTPKKANYNGININNESSKYFPDNQMYDDKISHNKNNAGCPPGKVRCKNGLKCIKSENWCDGFVHCNDTSDETNCTCEDRLDPRKICDGYFDCPLGEDELGCFGCNTSAFSCEDWDQHSPQSTCLNMDQRCDGEKDCPNNKDETECLLLEDTVFPEQVFPVSYINGFLHRNWRGKWYPTCNTDETWPIEACQAVGSSLTSIPITEKLSIPYYSGDFLSLQDDNTFKLVKSCEEGVVYIKCPEITCGSRLPATIERFKHASENRRALFDRRKRFYELPFTDVSDTIKIEINEGDDSDEFTWNKFHDNENNQRKNLEPKHQTEKPLRFELGIPNKKIILPNEEADSSLKFYLEVPDDGKSIPPKHDNTDRPSKSNLDNSEEREHNNHSIAMDIFGRKIRSVSESVEPENMTNFENNSESEGEQKEMIEEDVGHSKRVVGGQASQPGAWPWVVALYRDGRFHCGGVLLDENWIVTAAHCVDGFVNHYYEIQAGMLRRFSFSPAEQTRAVSYIVLHSQYDRSDMRNDLALIKVKQPLRLNRWVRPACLPPFDFFPLPETYCTAVGWGATVERGPDPDQMREVEVPILRQCKHKEDKEANEICAGVQEGGHDACQGDSGGPLLCRRLDDATRYYVAGIVSHGEGCGRPDEPGAYTRVAVYKRWIEKIKGRSVPSVLPKQTCLGMQCSSGNKRCLPLRKKCDKVVDCLNAEDEINCPPDTSIYAKVTRHISSSKKIPVSPTIMETPIDFVSSEQTTRINDITTIDPVTEFLPTSVNEVDIEELKPKEVPKSLPVVEFSTESINDTVQTEDTSKILSTTETSESVSHGFSTDSTTKFNLQMIPQTILLKNYCDGVVDCEDLSDETDCTCILKLLTIKPRFVCDDYMDCPDGSDEKDCSNCGKDEFYCYKSKTCIPANYKCDHNLDCPQQEDESDCFALTDGVSIHIDSEEMPQKQSEGVFTYSLAGIWSPFCVKKSTDQTLIASNICTYLGYSGYISFDESIVYHRAMNIISPIPAYTDGRYSTSYSPDIRALTDVINEITPAQPCTGLHVKCWSRLVGDVSTFKINVLSDKEEYEWPWHASVYVLGKYICSATLLNTWWLLADAHLFENI